MSKEQPIKKIEMGLCEGCGYKSGWEELLSTIGILQAENEAKDKEIAALKELVKELLLAVPERRMI